MSLFVCVFVFSVSTHFGLQEHKARGDLSEYCHLSQPRVFPSLTEQGLGKSTEAPEFGHRGPLNPAAPIGVAIPLPPTKSLRYSVDTVEGNN